MTFKRRMNMPYLKIETNSALSPGEKLYFLKKASLFLSKMLNKPEKVILVSLYDSVPMIFAGNTDPGAYLILKSIGLTKDKCPELSSALCELLQSELGILPERVYIDFNDINGKMFGWNKTTF